MLTVPRKLGPAEQQQPQLARAGVNAVLPATALPGQQQLAASEAEPGPSPDVSKPGEATCNLSGLLWLHLVWIASLSALNAAQNLFSACT